MSSLTMPEPKILALAAVLLLLTVLVFWESLQNLWARWGTSEELSHSYFIPVISAGLLWMRRDALIAALGKPWIPGLILSGVGLVFAVAGGLIDVPLVSQGGLVLFLGGIPGAIWGRKVFILSLIPMLYLFLMVPPPHMLITIMSAKFQHMSTELGVAMIRLMSIPVHNSGNVIDLGEHQLEVVDACSGLRYLFPFMSLGAIAAYIYKGSWWERLIVFSVTVPITIVMNSLRIALTAALVSKFGTQHAEGTVHMFEGWMVFLFCLAILYGVIWLLAKFVQKRPVAEVFGVPDILPEAKLTGAEAYQFRPSAMATLGIIAALIASLAIIKLIGTKVIYEPDRLEFATLPLEFPDYASREKSVSVAMENTIGADDFIITDFSRPEMRAAV
ncbi:MAG: exosortase, partial [Parvularculaceae bacterium]